MRRIASFSDTAPRPWANGAGETTELVSLAESAVLTPDRRPWRLSIARLESPGPFSSLPGMARTFLPTAEVELTIDGSVHRAGPGLPLDFDGGADVVLTRLLQPCFAVNLMVVTDEGELPGLTMITAPRRNAELPSTVPRFVLTLTADDQWERFDLLDVTGAGDPGGAGDLPDRLGVIGFV